MDEVGSGVGGWKMEWVRWEVGTGGGGMGEAGGGMGGGVGG